MKMSSALIAKILQQFGFIFLLPVLAFADEHGGHGAHELPPFGEFIAALGVYWINFLLFSAIIFYFGRKALGSAWVARRNKISEHISTAREALAQSQIALHDAERRVSSMRSDAEQLKRDISRETESEVQQIMSDAKSRAERIVKLARDGAAAEQKAAERNVRKELVELAIQRSREKLAKELTAETDRQFRETAVSGIRSLVQ